MSGFEWLFRMRMLVSGARGVASGRAPRPMRRTGSEVIGMALCLPVEGFLILHHFGEAPARRSAGRISSKPEVIPSQKARWDILVCRQTGHVLDTASIVRDV